MKPVLILSACILLLACFPSREPEVTAQLEKIAAAATETIDNELDKLMEITAGGIDLQAALAVVNALGKTFAPRQTEYADTQRDLLWCIESYVDPGIVEPLVRASLGVSPAARAQIVRHLSGVDSPEAVAAVLALLGETRNTAELTFLSLPGWSRKLIQPDAIFPKLLDLLVFKNYRDEILNVTIEYLRAKKIGSERLRGHAEALLEIYRVFNRDLAAVAPSTDKKNWFYDEEYLACRERPALLLDIFGYLDDNRADALLEEALASSDPRLAHFAAVSLIVKAKSVPAERLSFIARDPEMRKWLFKSLSAAGKPELFPAAELSQEKLAESDMVNWLIFPTELGTAPDEIELAEVVSIDTETRDGVIEYFIFKFRTLPPHWAAEDGWMAGVSGPYIKTEYPTIEAYGDTFSNFEPWDSKTPEEHLALVRQTLQNWRENQDR